MFKHLGSSSSSITLITKISSSESINLCGAPTSPLELEWMFQKDRESTQNGLMAFLVPQCRRIVSRGKHLLKLWALLLLTNPCFRRFKGRDRLSGRIFQGKSPTMHRLPPRSLGSPLQTLEEEQLSPGLGISAPDRWPCQHFGGVSRLPLSSTAAAKCRCG